MIRDDDGAPYETLNVNLCKELQSLLKDKNKFRMHVPNIECNNDWFILKHPRSSGILKVKLSTVPSSLEKQVAKKTAEIRCPKDSKILKELGTYSGLGSMSGDVVKQNNRTTSNRNFCKIGIISSISRI